MIDTDEEERPLDVHEVTLVVNLLTETDITLTEIADRIQCPLSAVNAINRKFSARDFRERRRSEEHTSELQSQSNLVCRLLLEKKKKNAHRRAGYKFRSIRSAWRLVSAR